MGQTKLIAKLKGVFPKHLTVSELFKGGMIVLDTCESTKKSEESAAGYTNAGVFKQKSQL